MKNGMPALRANIKLFDLVVDVDGPLEGELKDWPNNIQDQVYAALERASHKVQLPLTIVASKCDVDYGGTGQADRFFVHCVASEIVVMDDRKISAALQGLAHVNA